MLITTVENGLNLRCKNDIKFRHFLSIGNQICRKYFIKIDLYKMKYFCFKDVEYKYCRAINSQNKKSRIFHDSSLSFKVNFAFLQH